MRATEDGFNRCPNCDSDMINCSAYAILPDASVYCESCGLSIEFRVPWEDMIREAHDKECIKRLRSAWNSINMKA